MKKTQLSSSTSAAFNAEELEARFELKPWISGSCPEDCVCEPEGQAEITQIAG